MIGDTISIRQASSSPWATLPDQVSNSVALAKVNQDNFGAEYRFQGAAGRYIARVRNSIEPATAVRPLTHRHNVELNYLVPGATSADPELLYQCYVIGRFSPLGTLDLKEAIWYAATTCLTEAQFDKVLNFES